MKLFAKMFLLFTTVLTSALLLSGYLLITESFENAVNREKEFAWNQYQYHKYTLQAMLLTRPEQLFGGTALESFTSNTIAGNMSYSNEESMLACYTEEGELLFSNLPEQMTSSLRGGIPEDSVIMEFQKARGSSYYTIGGKVTQGENTLYLVTGIDITTVIMQRDDMIASFRNIYFITIGTGMILMLALSALLTSPIKRLTRAAARIAAGNYEERVEVGSRDEIGELSHSFSAMAEAVEFQMKELKKSVRQKEDFIASFAHELKTPLTSVVGYADLLYQKELPREEAKKAAWFILNEGLRLEALSQKLMELIMLEKQDFVLEEMQVEELIQDIRDGMQPMLQNNKMMVFTELAPSLVRVEYDLFKTLILNIVDNSIKAEADTIRIKGRITEKGYLLSFSDNGRGIPGEELEKVTEAFYMVDKSRSRSRHGVGLGLALGEAIAKVHGTRLVIRSAPGVGTEIEMVLSCKEEKGGNSHEGN